MIGSADPAEQLTAAALAGDEDALGRLLAAHQQVAYSVAFRILGSEPDAADAVQEACLSAVRALKSEDTRPRDPQAFRAWFLRIVTNAALQRLRRKPRLPSIPVDDVVEQLPDDDGEEPAEEIERRETRGDVLRALLALPEAQRAVLTLREFEELSYDEIAQSLGTSRMAVQMLLFRARRNFRSAYEGVAAENRTIGCAELAPLLSALLDSEVGARSWVQLSLHLAHCGRCRSELGGLRKARRLAAAIPLIPLPPLLTTPAIPATGAVIQAAALAPMAPAAVGGALQIGGLAAAALVVVAAGFGISVVTSPAGLDFEASPAAPPIVAAAQAIVEPIANPESLLVAHAAVSLDEQPRLADSDLAAAAAPATGEAIEASIEAGEDSNVAGNQTAAPNTTHRDDARNGASAAVSGTRGPPGAAGAAAEPNGLPGLAQPLNVRESADASVSMDAIASGDPAILVDVSAPADVPVATSVPEVVPTLATQAVDAAATPVQAVADLAANAVDPVTDVVATPVQVVVDAAGTAIPQLPGVTDVPAAVATAVQPVLDLVTAAPTAVSGAATAIAPPAETITSIGGQAATAVATLASGPGQTVNAVQSAIPTTVSPPPLPTARPTATPVPAPLPPVVPTAIPQVTVQVPAVSTLPVRL